MPAARPTAATVADYLASLPPDRRAAIAHVRAAVNARLPRGYEEAMQFGMISWVVPASRLGATYNGQPLVLASLASQKQHMALYLMSVYGNPELAAWFRDAYRRTGKKLDMGKSCVRFKAVDALALDVIGEAIARVPVDAYVAAYEVARSRTVTPVPVGKPARPRRAATAPTPASRKRR
jgi:uncharacterized protein YdhG (YjbR/CyaY superfamily)